MYGLAVHHADDGLLLDQQRVLARHQDRKGCAYGCPSWQVAGPVRCDYQGARKPAGAKLIADPSANIQRMNEHDNSYRKQFRDK